MSMFTKPGELRASGQGFFGDLAFRLRLFFGHERIVETMNKVEGAVATLRTVGYGSDTDDLGPLAAAAGIGRNELTAAAEADLEAAAETLREFVFGPKPDMPACPMFKFDGPDQCAAAIDSASDDLQIRADGRVFNLAGREVSPDKILTYRRPM